MPRMSSRTSKGNGTVPRPNGNPSRKVTDLPPEIFERIIGFYVSGSNLVSAYKNRAVCRTFDFYIRQDIYRNHQTHELAEYRGKKRILEAGLAQHAAYRIFPQRRDDTVVDKIILSVREKIVSLPSRGGPDDKDNELLHKVAEAVVKHFARAFKILTTNGPRFHPKQFYMANDVQHNALCVAVALAEIPLISDLLAEGASLWKQTKPFGYPLDVAIHAENIEVLDFILATRAPGMSPTVQYKHIMAVITSQENKIEWKKLRKPRFAPVTTVMRHFVNWCMGFLTLNRKHRDVLLEWTIALEMHDALVKILTTTKFTKLQRDAATASYFKHPPNEHVLDAMLQAGMVSIKESYIFPGVYGKYDSFGRYWDGHIPAICVLDHAVYHENERVVRLVLEKGAPPNGVKRFPNKPEGATGSQEHTNPLKKAIERGNEAIAELLLKYGADPEGVGLWDWDTCLLESCEWEFGRGCPIWRELRKKIYEKVDALAPFYTMPGHAVHYYSENLSKRYLSRMPIPKADLWAPLRTHSRGKIE